MVEISEIGLKEEEEVELDLGLSIGGSFRRSEKIIQPDPNLKDSNHHHHQQYQANVIMDPERVKREIHALRRMEAKKKREEKQQNKRHVMRESEPEFQNRASKREKTDLNLNATTASSTASFHHHPPYAYVQLNGDNSNNGYAYPCVVPWMVAPVPAVAVACGEKEKNAGQPEKGFRPFSPGNGYGSSEKDCCGADNNKKDKSDGSSSTTMCSSSVVSDYRSSSHEGGGSSESHSHSVHSVAAEPTNNNNNSKENNNMMITKRSHQGDQSQSASSHPIITSDNSNAAQSTNNLHIDQTKPSTTKYNNKKPSSPNNNEMKKLPPKPQLPPSTTSSFGLQKMPYVSTTGNGPNGKRVNGFLYRYSSKSEVSIVCVCHGSTFSPAEFVQHAGGTDISHPERHITVIPTPSFS